MTGRALERGAAVESETVGALPALVRRWAVEWLGASNPAVCEEILTP